ncbi:MAG: ribonuclease P protein component [Myxococcota bacterium]|nr:ribonuclease P protein component [Myxococcota bacterium]
MSAPAAGRGSEKFPKSLRLTTRREFLKVQDRGFKVTAEPLLGLALKNELGVTRLGITVSSKVGNAVVRTRIRRRLREIFRRRRSELPVGLDVVLIARSGAKGADLETFARAFGVIASRLRSRKW